VIPTLDDAFDFDQRRPTLRNFRSVVASHVELFRTQRDHVHKLLGGRHAYSSGVFREDLLRRFLSSVLPRSVSVDSGFVYGFDQVPTSKQIDILVWDSSRHAAVFQAGEFVIVPPESVIAAVSVKTSLGKAELEDALTNLNSIVPLDLAFRSSTDEKGDTPIHRPILKVVAAYEGPVNVSTAVETISQFYQALFALDAKLASRMKSVLRDFNPVHPSVLHVHELQRVFPSLVLAIDKNPQSMIRGLGPPEDRIGAETFGPGLRRLPYLYPQSSQLTTPLEKLVYHVLSATYSTIGTLGWSLVSAWGEMHPIWGFRVGDADEMDEPSGASLLDPLNLAG
jgi:hypothetical protein